MIFSVRAVPAVGSALIFSLATTSYDAIAFEFPSLPAFFSPVKGETSLDAKKIALLNAVSDTENGKSASVETQAAVLKLVRDIELTAPAPADLLSNPTEASKLDGVWYLQYTSPSEVEGQNGAEDADDAVAWRAVNASEGDSNIPTNADGSFKAQGTVSATGITVDTSNRPTKQTFDVANRLVANDVTLPNNVRISVNGSFRQSDTVPNRALVAFTAASIELNLFNGALPIRIVLDFVFSILAKIRGTPDNGWLETTYVEDDLRIGRGNKGTMFILTRDPDAVRP